MSAEHSDTLCPSCGIPVDPSRQAACPKCQAKLGTAAALPLLEVDVAHAGEDWETARRKIEEGVDRTLHRGHAGVKIIHGHGSATGRSVIAPRAVALMKQLARRHDGRFTRDRHNPGAHLIWFNR